MNKSNLGQTILVLVTTVLGLLAASVIIQIPIIETDDWQSLGSFPPGEIEDVFLDQYWNKSVTVRDGTVYIYKEHTGTWGKPKKEGEKRLQSQRCRPLHLKGEVDIKYCYFELDNCGPYNHEIYLVVMKSGEVLSRSATITKIAYWGWPTVRVMLSFGSVVGMIAGISIIIWQHVKRRAVAQQKALE